MIPTKLNIVAKTIAALGESTLVETTVAIAFGASVHPFTKIDAHTRISAKKSARFIK
jgi:hypothetical protein